MTYVYDILLNFNRDLIEFFEWEELDDIKYVKKIVLYKTSFSVLNDIIKNYVYIDDDFKNSVPKYDFNRNYDNGRLLLLTDGKLVIGLLILRDEILLSRLLPDEEQEVLLIAQDLSNISFGYKIIGEREDFGSGLTRREKCVKNKLILELNNLYHNNNYEKLRYLYYEFTGKESRDVSYIYRYLLDSLNHFSNVHLKLFDILVLSNAGFN